MIVVGVKADGGRRHRRDPIEARGPAVGQRPRHCRVHVLAHHGHHGQGRVMGGHVLVWGRKAVKPVEAKVVAIETPREPDRAPVLQQRSDLATSPHPDSPAVVYDWVGATEGAKGKGNISGMLKVFCDGLSGPKQHQRVRSLVRVSMDGARHFLTQSSKVGAGIVIFSEPFWWDAEMAVHPLDPQPDFDYMQQHDGENDMTFAARCYDEMSMSTSVWLRQIAVRRAAIPGKGKAST